jgi:sodium-dependent dicarboxylate transporter 2/3/5
MAVWWMTEAVPLPATALLPIVLFPDLGDRFIIAAVVVALGELASNTAIAAVFPPVAGAAGVGMGLPPTFLALTVALAASVGFMLPVATPPMRSCLAVASCARARCSVLARHSMSSASW